MPYSLDSVAAKRAGRGERTATRFVFHLHTVEFDENFVRKSGLNVECACRAAFAAMNGVGLQTAAMACAKREQLEMV